MNDTARRVALMGLMTALMLLLGYIESRIPVLIAVPGIKLGLSNSVLIYAVIMLGKKEAWLLMLVKAALSAALFGNPAVFIYSLAGGALSLVAMTLLAGRLGIITVSIIGAACHNIGQIAVAFALGFAPLQAMLYYAGILTLTAIATGGLTGLIAGIVIKRVSPKV